MHIILFFKKDLEEMESKEFDKKAFLEENQDVMKDLLDPRISIEKSMRKSNFSKKNVEDCDKFEDVGRKRKELRLYM
jgi:hypothetical protein